MTMLTWQKMLQYMSFRELKALFASLSMYDSVLYTSKYSTWEFDYMPVNKLIVKWTYNGKLRQTFNLTLEEF